MSKKKKIKDPHAQREASNYENPVASREYILELLEASEGPLSHKALCAVLSLDDENAIEALRRRLIAMVRDGQLISNRKGAFGRIDKMDLVKGRILAHKDGYGFIRPSDGGDDIYLTNRQMRKVFDGDEVLARKGQTNFRGQVEGAIVEVLQRNTLQLVGKFVNDHGNCYLQPDNTKVHHDIFIEQDSTKGAQNGQIVVVQITQQPARNKRAQGVVAEILGDHLAPGMEIDVAIRSHSIPHVWPQAVLDDSSKYRPVVEEADKAHRIDLRDTPFVTIDGEDARDFDDAVFCEPKASGGWRVYVAIADVSHYVQPGSALDLEAQNRGNSVYFPDFVVPMLPETLSNGLCSLNPLVDRLCMVCEMTISASGRVSGYHFYEAVMHSKARLTYTQVGQVIAEKNQKDSALRQELAHVVDHLDELYRLYECLHAARAVRGAIDFETTETRIEFDESRKIKQIVPVHRNDAHRLIEECMLAANVCAAKFLEAHELPALYRVHESPKEEKLALLHTFLAELGLSMPGREKVLPSDYQLVLSQAAGRPDANLIQTVMLRSMNQAVYQPNNLGHFGLSYTAYAHFTSPIRRYPDLLVHRAIRSVIRSTKASKKVKRVDSAQPLPLAKIYPYSEGDMERFGDQCSLTERRADDATRDVISWLKCEYLQERVGQDFTGVVTGVTGFGLFVELKDLYVEGLVHITSLPQDYYQYSAAHHRLTGERTHQSFHLGDELQVQVARVSLDDRKVDFELIGVATTARKPSKSKKGRKPTKPSDKDALSSGRSPRKRALKAASSVEDKSVEGKQTANPAKKKKPRSKPSLANTQAKTKAKTKTKAKSKPKAKAKVKPKSKASTRAKPKK